MWKPYLKVIRKKAPQPIHVLGRLHIMAKMNKAINEVRAAEVKRLNRDGYEPVLKNSRWCLLKREENLTEKQERTEAMKSFTRLIVSVVAVVMCVLANRGRAAEETPTPIDIGTRKQLFIDDYIVAETKGVFRTLNQPVKYKGNPLIRPRKPRTGEPELVIMGGSVIYDGEEKLFKMWYEATDHQRTHSAMAYATSKDGIHWDLPHQGRIAFPEWRDPRFGTGPTDNNFVFDRPPELCPCVFKDPAAKTPDRKYKMIYREASGGKEGVYAAFSPDGVHWSGETGPIIPLADSFHSVLWDAKLARYVAHTRYEIYSNGYLKRQVLQSESEDFIHWTPYGVIMKADAEDPPQNRQFYNMEWMPYEGVFIGFLSVYHVAPGPERQSERHKPKEAWEDKIDIQLTFSRDNRHWIRAGNRQTFLPTSALPGDYDFGMIWNVLQHPIVVGDEIFIYYNGTSGLHWAFTRKEVEGGVIALAKLRLDGFVSLDVGSSLGTVTTRPMTTTGEKLIVNADARFGSIRVEVLDADGSPVKGFGKEDADPLTGDSVRHEVTWNGKGSMSRVRAAPFALRFHMDRAKLYSFVFQGFEGKGVRNLFPPEPWRTQIRLTEEGS